MSEGKSLHIFSELPIPLYLKGINMALLWNLWELIITETPLLVVTNRPEEASYSPTFWRAGRAIIGIIISLIHPLQYSGDYRPYVTMYDADVKEYAEMAKSKSLAKIMLGACNPYFSKVSAATHQYNV